MILMLKSGHLILFPATDEAPRDWKQLVGNDAVSTWAQYLLSRGCLEPDMFFNAPVHEQLDALRFQSIHFCHTH